EDFPGQERADAADDAPGEIADGRAAVAPSQRAHEQNQRQGDESPQRRDGEFLPGRHGMALDASIDRTIARTRPQRVTFAGCVRRQTLAMVAATSTAASTRS